jgi:hypothetical protein
MTITIKCKGRQGDWLVEVPLDNETQKLPSAYRHWVKGLSYSRAISQEEQAKEKSWAEALLKHKRVVMTEEGKNGKPRINIAVFDVDNIVVDNDFASFDLVKRVANCK